MHGAARQPEETKRAQWFSHGRKEPLFESCPAGLEEPGRGGWGTLEEPGGGWRSLGRLEEPGRAWGSLGDPGGPWGGWKSLVLAKPLLQQIKNPREEQRSLLHGDISFQVPTTTKRVNTFTERPTQVVSHSYLAQVSKMCKLPPEAPLIGDLGAFRPTGEKECFWFLVRSRFGPLWRLILTQRTFQCEGH